MNPRHKLIHLGAAVLLVITSLLLSPVTPVGAVPTDRYVEKTGTDAGDCSNNLSPCLTIGYAIGQSADGDTVYIGSGIFIENVYVNLDLAINGSGADYTFIDGGGVGPTMHIDGGNTVVVNDLSLVAGDAGTNDGGGVLNNGILTMNRVDIFNNTADDGAGVYTDGPLTMYDSEISWNTSTGAYGGGIFANTASTVNLTRVTIHHNNTPYGSGAIHIQGGGTLNLTNVTLMGNTSLYSTMVGTLGTTTTILNSTIAANTNSDGFSTALSIYGAVSFKNTILSGNSAANCNPAAATTWTSLGNNLDSGTTCTFVAGGDQSSTDPQLISLLDNGGYVPTLLMQGTSPAIDSGTNTGCPAEDARGLSRPVDGPGAGSAVCDKGAVETRAQTTSFGVTSMAPSPSVIGQDITLAGTVVGSSTTPTGNLEISAPNGPYTITCTPTLSGGFANCGMNFTTPGGRGVSFHYPGDGTHDVAWSFQYHIVNQASRTDFDKDGVSDMGKFIPSTNTLWWRNTYSGTMHGVSMGSPVTQYVGRSDFDGDAITDPTKYVASGQALWFYGSLSSSWWGIYVGSNAYLLPGSDFDGDAVTDPAKYTSDGSIWRLLSDTDTWVGTFIGTDAAPALPGSDYDGDGKTDLAKYVPGAGAIWYFGSGDSLWHGVYIGSDGTPVPASDFDADGKTDMAKYLTGSNTLWYQRSSDLAWVGTYLGPGSFIYVPSSDFDGDGKTDPAKFDTVGKGLWWLKSTNGQWGSAYMGGETYSIVN